MGWCSVSHLSRSAVAPEQGLRRAWRYRRGAARGSVDDLPARFDDQRSQSQSCDVLHGISAAVRGSVPGVQSTSVPVSRLGIHLYRNLVVPYPGDRCVGCLEDHTSTLRNLSCRTAGYGSALCRSRHQAGSSGGAMSEGIKSWAQALAQNNLSPEQRAVLETMVSDGQAETLSRGRPAGLAGNRHSSGRTHVWVLV